MAVMLSNKGNAMATAAAVRERMDELQKFFPGDMKWDAPYDTSKFVSISIKKVVQTLAEAILLVLVVMFLFLQNIPLYPDSDHCRTDFAAGRVCLPAISRYVD